MRDVNLRLAPGERIVVGGPSGCGKSTLLACLAGATEPDAGSISFSGHAYGRRLLFQHPTQALDPRFTALESVTEPLLFDTSAKEDAQALLARVGLPAELGRRRPAELSGGERQRVALARALAGRPDIIFADEPVSALDPTARAEVLDLLLRSQAELGFACVIVSHDPAVHAAASRLVVLDAGCVVSDGPV